MHVRIAVASLVATGALVLLATTSDGQTVSTAEASVNGSHEGKSRASADDAAIRRKAEAKLNALPQFVTTIDRVGIHVDLPATVPPDVATVLNAGGPVPEGLSEKERAAFDSLDTFYKKNRAYVAVMNTRPQTVGYALADSPAGLAAWMYDYNRGEPERLLTKDEMLDDVTL